MYSNVNNLRVVLNGAQMPLSYFFKCCNESEDELDKYKWRRLQMKCLSCQNVRVLSVHVKEESVKQKKIIILYCAACRINRHQVIIREI